MSSMMRQSGDADVCLKSKGHLVQKVYLVGLVGKGPNSTNIQEKRNVLEVDQDWALVTAARRDCPE